MSYLLNECKNLKIIDFSQIDTSKLKYYENIFNGLPENGTLKYNSKIFMNNLTKLLPINWALEDIK